MLTLAGVGAVRGGRTLFAAIDLTLNPGDAAMVQGPNGAGKSTLLRIAAGLFRPAAGHVAAAPCALVDARLALDPELSLAAALDFWWRIDRVDRAAAAVVLAAYGLDRLTTVPVRMLSTGQRQRAALARAVAGTAPLWLFDEPANGLDAPALAVMETDIAAHRARGGAVMVATHIPVALPGAARIML